MASLFNLGGDIAEIGEIVEKISNYIDKLDPNKRQNFINEDFDLYYYKKDLSKDESIKKVIENYKKPYSWVSHDVTSFAQISVRHVGVPRCQIYSINRPFLQ